MNKQRERLAGLIDDFCKKELGTNFNTNILEMFARHILADGWMRPPCKVGDVIYKPIITSKGEPAIWEIIITGIDVYINKKGVRDCSYVVGHLKNTQCGEGANFSDFGKTVFLTKEEAEEVLKGGVQGETNL